MNNDRQKSFMNRAKREQNERKEIDLDRHEHCASIVYAFSYST